MTDKSRVSRPQPAKASQAVEHYFRVLDNVQASANAQPQATKLDIANEIAREQKIKNDNAEQDIELKRQTLNRLFRLLGTETALVFIFAFCQAMRWPHDFHLENWSFKLLVGVTITQITAMLFAAVNYLFPKGRG
jgi:hypothetical protein